MDTTIDTIVTTDDLARRLPEVLDRVQKRGERFTIARNGEPIAHLTPTPTTRRFTVADFLALWERMPRPDDAFTDDMEAIQAAQGRTEPPGWPS